MTKDKRFNCRFYLCCGLFIWFIINLLQGVFTEIQEDEAYYALYGEHLAWGYFDHPPMVGLMTFLSGLHFILVGCFFFFWLTAFHGHVEPHWTLVGVIPATVFYRSLPRKVA